MPTVDIISPGGAFTPAAVGNGSTDDAPAFRAFNDWARIQTSPITLTLGSGAKTFLFNSTDSNNQRGNSPAWNVPQPLTILGNGSTTSILKAGASGGFFLVSQSSLKSGNGNFGSTSTWTARLDSVASGATQVHCKTLADALLFSANTWSVITGLDMMKVGVPMNPGFFEYVFITNVNTSTGVITFSAPLVNSYLDTWPFFSAGTPGLSPDQGGPATLYALDPSFDINATYQSLGIDGVGVAQIYSTGRTINFINVKTTTVLLIPSFNQTITYTNCDLTSGLIEVDKMVETLIYDNTSTSQLMFQSQCFHNVIIRNGSNISSLNGTPQHLTVTNSTTGNVGLGVLAFGRTDSFVTSGSTFTGSFANGGVVDNGDITHAGIQVDYTMSGSVIRIPKAGLDYGCRWAIPGTWCYFSGGSVAWGPVFKVNYVTVDATYIYVNTNWTGNGFPSWATAINVLPSRYVSFDANTVSSTPNVVNLKNNTAAGYTGVAIRTTAQLDHTSLGYDTTGATIALPQVSGRLVHYIIDVVTPYTGTNNPLFWHAGAEFDNAVVVKPDMTTTTYGPHIDLRATGRRVITPLGVTSFGADSGLTLPDPAAWFTTFLADLCTNQDIRSEAGVGPLVNIDILTDQGIPPDVTTNIIGFSVIEGGGKVRTKMVAY